MRSHSRLTALIAAAAIAIAAGGAGAQVTSPDQVERDERATSATKKQAAAKAKAKAAAKAKQAKATKKKVAAAKAKAEKAQKAKAKQKKLAAAKAKQRKLAAKRRAAHKVASAPGATPPSTNGKRADNMPAGWAWPPSPAMLAAGAACTDQLDALGVVWKQGKAEDKVAMPIVVPSMEIGGIALHSQFRKGPHVMDCHLALALATHAPQLFALGVREIGFSRIHGYTNVRVGGVEKNVLSRHALGLAIDIKWFVDVTGRKVVVLTDYPRADPFLRALEAYLSDSGAFRTVLTPGNDPASHDDHFHVETKVEYGDR